MSGYSEGQKETIRPDFNRSIVMYCQSAKLSSVPYMTHRLGGWVMSPFGVAQLDHGMHSRHQKAQNKVRRGNAA